MILSFRDPTTFMNSESCLKNNPDFMQAFSFSVGRVVVSREAKHIIRTRAWAYSMHHLVNIETAGTFAGSDISETFGGLVKCD